MRSTSSPRVNIHKRSNRTSPIKTSSLVISITNNGNSSASSRKVVMTSGATPRTVKGSKQNTFVPRMKHLRNGSSKRRSYAPATPTREAHPRLPTKRTLSASRPERTLDHTSRSSSYHTPTTPLHFADQQIFRPATPVIAGAACSSSLSDVCVDPTCHYEAAALMAELGINSFGTNESGLGTLRQWTTVQSTEELGWRHLIEAYQLETFGTNA